MDAKDRQRETLGRNRAGDQMDGAPLPLPACHGFGASNPYLEVFSAPPAARTSRSDDSAVSSSLSMRPFSSPSTTSQSSPTSTSSLDVTFTSLRPFRNRIIGGYRCEPCGWTFKRKLDLTQHWSSHPAHAFEYCPICKTLIPEERGIHLRLCHAICGLCWFRGINIDDLLAHERLDHLFCQPCNFYSQSMSQMAAHLGSERHRIATVQCLFCHFLAGSISIMLAHLEFGRCPSGFRKVDMPYLIAAYDQHNQVFSDQYAPVARDQPFHAPCGALIATATRCDSSTGGLPFHCCFCEMAFSSLDQLNRHLGSPVHNGVIAKNYRCPGTGCGERKYESMSALVLHIEAAGCDAHGMPTVIKALDNFMSGFRGIAIGGK